MKRVGTIATCLAAGCLLNSSLRAQDEALPGNPYAVAVVRNIFGLNPPPPVDPNANKPAEPPVKVIPNGIMSIFGQLQVLFKVAAKPGGKDATYMLTEGQSQDDIEVIKIDEKAASVTFNNHGVVQELPLVVTPPSSTPAAAAPTVPGRSLRMPGGASAGSPFGNRFPVRAQDGSTIRSTDNNADGANNDSLRSIPTRTYQPPTIPNEDPALSAAEILINTEKMRLSGDPKHVIMPPIRGFSPPPDSNPEP